MKSYFCQDEYGQIAPVYSIGAECVPKVKEYVRSMKNAVREA